MRKRPLKLEQLGILNKRTQLLKEEVDEFNNLKYGWQGEQEFDEIVDEKIKGSNVIHIKDYRFKAYDRDSEGRKVEASKSEVQIDNILISGDKIYTFDIKNYNHDLIYSPNRWTYTNGTSYINPMNQIDRQNDRFTYLIKPLMKNHSIVSGIVFINPKQYIYNLPFNTNIITANNVEKTLDLIVRQNSHNYSNLITFLENKHLHQSIFDNNVRINFQDLRSGVFCADCYGSMYKQNKSAFCCTECKTLTNILEVVKRLIEEISILNPGWTVNSEILSEFSGRNISASCIRRYKSKKLIKY